MNMVQAVFHIVRTLEVLSGIIMDSSSSTLLSSACQGILKPAVLKVKLRLLLPPSLVQAGQQSANEERLCWFCQQGELPWKSLAEILLISLA